MFTLFKLCGAPFIIPVKSSNKLHKLTGYMSINFFMNKPTPLSKLSIVSTDNLGFLFNK